MHLFQCQKNTWANVIDIGYFHTGYFYSYCLRFHFPSGQNSEICGTDLKGATFSLTLAQNSSLQTASKQQTHLFHLVTGQAKINFVLHSKSLSAFSITLLTLKGAGEMRKDVDVSWFHSIQSIILFMELPGPSEKQRYLYPGWNIAKLGGIPDVTPGSDHNDWLVS